MPKPSFNSGSAIFALSVNGNIIQPYSNAQAAYNHFIAVKTEGYSKPLGYSQFLRRMHKSGVYSYTSLNHIIYVVTKYSVLPSYIN